MNVPELSPLALGPGATLSSVRSTTVGEETDFEDNAVVILVATLVGER